MTNAATSTPSDTIAVLGGTGTTGRRVAERLERLGHPVRIGSRRGTPAFDWDDPTTWDAVLDGVGTAYLAYSPDVSFPGAAEAVGGVAAAAVRHGVRRLVLLSGRGEEDAWPAEQAVRESGAEWTIVRCSVFAQNFSEHFLLEPVLAGEIALPAGDVAEPFLDIDDLADVAVAALTEDGHAGRTYELTGPRLLTFADVAAELTRATGRSIRYVPVTADEYAAAAADWGVPAEEVAALTELFTRIFDGHNAFVCDDVRQVLGRPARDFAEYARTAAATGVWAVDPAAGAADAAGAAGSVAAAGSAAHGEAAR
jgi:uncharacterized protein YbjT (DUF2867 family)